MFRVVFMIVIMLGIRQFEPWGPGWARDRGRWGGGGGAKNDEQIGKISQNIFSKINLYCS